MRTLITQLVQNDVLKLTLKVNKQAKPYSAKNGINYLQISPKRTKDTVRSSFFCSVISNDIINKVMTITTPDTVISNAIKHEINFYLCVNYADILSIIQYVPAVPTTPDTVIARLVKKRQLGNPQPNLGLPNPVDFINNFNVIII